MQKPNSYEETQTGEFTPINLGGHTCIIKRVEETTSKTGKPMIKIAIDFDGNDSQPTYFMTSFQNDTREDKKWPYNGTQYILSEDKDGKCSRSFKSFITSVEKSNNCECVWGDGFASWFTGKRVGVVFGEVEEEYNGEIKTRRKIRYFCQYDKAATADIPEKKLLNAGTGASTTTAQSGTPGFMNIPDGVMEEIPF